MNFFGIVILLFTFRVGVIWSQDTRDFKQFLDRRVNPCEDFYRYSCGRWTPGNDDAVDVVTDQKMENRNIMRQHFSSLRRRSIHDNPAREFYMLCLGSKLQSDAESLQSYLSVLLEISQWPYLNETFEVSSYSWVKVAAELRRFRVDTLFKVYIYGSWKDSRQYIIYLTESRQLFDGPADGDAAYVYKSFVKHLLMGFGVRVRKANLIAQEVVNFEVELDKLSWDVENELRAPISLDSLIRQVPDINWQLYFETLLGQPVRHDQLLVVQVDLMRKFKDLLDKTKPETVALFQLARFLHHFGEKTDPPDWISCMDEVNNRMPLTVAKDLLGLGRTFSESKVKQIFENIRSQFQQQMNATIWYNSKAKEEHLNKLEGMKILIGYPEVELHHQREIQIDRDSYEKSQMLLEKQIAQNEFSLLTRPSDLFNNNLKPLLVNAYYRLTTNTLEIPMGILRPPMYRETSNSAQIMGSLGTIIAHELVHGFDYDGQNYDKSGNVNTEKNPKTTIQFGLRAHCFIDQYSEGRVAALNEDIADNEGLRVAYGAYERLRASDPYIDSAITGDQLFFLSFAQVWCGSETSANVKKPRNHSSHRDRVNNVVANSDKFADAFSCPLGSMLNPAKKCKIW